MVLRVYKYYDVILIKQDNIEFLLRIQLKAKSRKCFARNIDGDLKFRSAFGNKCIMVSECWRIEEGAIRFDETNCAFKSNLNQTN